MNKQIPDIPASVSKRDSRYILPYFELVKEELERRFKPGVRFSIVDATDQLKCLQALKPLTRHDVAGAIMRTMVSMEILTRESKSFLFPMKAKTNGQYHTKIKKRKPKAKSGRTRRSAS